eukprot:4991886-Pyramimonas_sp.AAC.2
MLTPKLREGKNPRCGRGVQSINSLLRCKMIVALISLMSLFRPPPPGLELLPPRDDIQPRKCPRPHPPWGVKPAR